MNHVVLLYYKYATVADPQGLVNRQRALCEKLQLKGRILIAGEGINGTVEGTKEATEEYIKTTCTEPGFADIHWKKSASDGSSFPKLAVKLRKDIVSNAIEEWGVDPAQATGKHLAPDELHKWFTEGKEFEIVDMRNDYEHDSGHFTGSILPAMHRFRELPQILKSLLPHKKKTVLTVCTGGVRCEKASAYLMKQGFEDVYQLDGGIVSYMERYPNQHFLGKLYVFDKRQVVGFETDTPNHTIIGKCKSCNAPSDLYSNCEYATCNSHYLRCKDCQASGKLGLYCTTKCRVCDIGHLGVKFEALMKKFYARVLHRART